MTQYNTLNVTLSNLQLNKLKSSTEVTLNGTEVTLNLSSNVVGNSNNEVNFSHKLFSTNTQVSKIRERFANGSLANIKFSKTQLSKMVQLERFLGRRFGLLLKTGLPSMDNILTPLVKIVWYPLVPAVQKKFFGSETTTLVFSNEDLNDNIKIIKSQC